MKNRYLISLLLLFVVQLFLNADINNKYLKEANSLYIIKEYPRAYNRIKFVLRGLDEPSKMSPELKKISEKIYYAYYKELLDKEEYIKIDSTFRKDIHFIYLVGESKRLKLLTQYFERRWQQVKETEKLAVRDKDSSTKETGKVDENYKRAVDLLYMQSRKESALYKELDQLKDERLELMRQEERAAFLKIQEQLISDRIEMEKRSNEQFGLLLQSVFDLRAEENANNSRLFTIVSLVSGGVTLVVALLFIILIIIIVVNNRRQQKSLMQLSLANNAAKESLLSLPLAGEVIEPVYVIDERKEREESGKAVRELPLPAERERERLRMLIEQCRSYSNEIDRVTNRKNGSKNVAELVYKLSLRLGYSEFDSMVYYGAALVYDIGFLNVEIDIPGKSELTSGELELVKEHTRRGNSLIHFIDEKYRPVFRDGIAKHHENIDGSGYPAGLKGGQIPYIARVLRVADSFVSMISSRDYKQITDKESALERLKSEGKYYDDEILKALEDVI